MIKAKRNPKTFFRANDARLFTANLIPGIIENVHSSKILKDINLEELRRIMKARPEDIVNDTISETHKVLINAVYNALKSMEHAWLEVDNK